MPLQALESRSKIIGSEPLEARPFLCKPERLLQKFIDGSIPAVQRSAPAMSLLR
jgi:hypothetical protein